MTATDSDDPYDDEDEEEEEDPENPAAEGEPAACQTHTLDDTIAEQMAGQDKKSLLCGCSRSTRSTRGKVC